ncbi:MAG: hypothetical protein V4719_19045 [Planctomycetota bacterium]
MSNSTIASISVESKCDALLEKIRGLFDHDIDASTQAEIAKLVFTLHRAKLAGILDYTGPLSIAVAAICQSPPALKLASELREEADKRITSNNNLLRQIIHPKTPPAAVVLGMGFVLYCAVPITLTFLPRLMTKPETLAIDGQLMAIVGIAGAIGSIVSIMVRIADFTKSSITDRSILFMTGAFKPVIGCAFAIFAFAAIKSKVIPLATEPVSEPYLAIALAFVSGFSERFAPDVVTAAEARFLGRKNDSIQYLQNRPQVDSGATALSQ